MLANKLKMTCYFRIVFHHHDFSVARKYNNVSQCAVKCKVLRKTLHQSTVYTDSSKLMRHNKNSLNETLYERLQMRVTRNYPNINELVSLRNGHQ